MLILQAIKDFVFIFLKHIAHGSWFVNRQEINRLELFWLELLELLETMTKPDLKFPAFCIRFVL